MDSWFGLPHIEFYTRDLRDTVVEDSSKIFSSKDPGLCLKLLQTPTQGL